jgi:hypothetical protein
MANKQQSSRTKVHPDLGKLDVSVTEFGEIAGSMDIDKINKFLNRNVEDKKLNKEQVDKDTL